MNSKFQRLQKLYFRPPRSMHLIPTSFKIRPRKGHGCQTGHHHFYGSIDIGNEIQKAVSVFSGSTDRKCNLAPTSELNHGECLTESYHASRGRAQDTIAGRLVIKTRNTVYARTDNLLLQKMAAMTWRFHSRNSSTAAVLATFFKAFGRQAFLPMQLVWLNFIVCLKSVLRANDYVDAARNPT
jgi:hypothetical protein